MVMVFPVPEVWPAPAIKMPLPVPDSLSEVSTATVATVRLLLEPNREVVPAKRFPLVVITLLSVLIKALLPAAAQGVPATKPSQLVSDVSHVPVKLGPFQVPVAAEAETLKRVVATKAAAMDVLRMRELFRGIMGFSIIVLIFRVSFYRTVVDEVT